MLVVTEIAALLFELLVSVSVLSLVLFAHVSLLERTRRLPGWLQPVLLGLTLGLAAALNMLAPFTPLPGIIFDGRHAAMAAAALWGGPIAGLIAAAIAAGTRLALGGPGAVPGVIALSVTTGLMIALDALCRRRGWGRAARLRLGTLTLAGAVPLALASARIPLTTSALLQIIPPVTVATIVAFLFLSMLLLREDERLEHLRLLEERRRAAQAANEAKGRFLAAMSHEMRTPLTGLLALLEVLRGEALSARGDDLLRGAQGAGRNLLALINQALDFSRIDSGHLVLQPQPTRLRELAAEVAALLRPEAEGKGLALTLVIPTDPGPVVLVDEGRFRQVLINLVGNAVKFTERGSVTLTASWADSGPKDSRFVFTVQDSGIGISPEFRQRLFTEFARDARAEERAIAGTGLGLAISHQIISAMGGRITVDSAPGLGSRFSIEVTLPRHVAPVDAGRAEPERTTRPLSILLAEDAPLNRRLIMEVLHTQGHKVTAVGDGLAAVDAVRHGAFDLVLMDVQMPGLDGIGATRAIRALVGPQARIPIFALSANAFAEQTSAYIAAGMTGSLAKPVDWEALRHVFATVVLSPAKRDPAGPGAPVAPEAADPPGAAAPLDLNQVDDLAQALGRGSALAMIRDALREAGEQTRLIAAADGDAASAWTQRQAHTLRGLSGSFGLAAVAAVAARLETAPDERPALLPELERALAHSAAALDRLERAAA